MRLSRPLFESQLPVGFPSPAEDYIEERVDLNRDLIFHPQYTYYARIAGDPMIEDALKNFMLSYFVCPAPSFLINEMKSIPTPTR
jgi:hypothetical protein